MTGPEISGDEIWSDYDRGLSLEIIAAKINRVEGKGKRAAMAKARRIIIQRIRTEKRQKKEVGVGE